MIRNCAHYRVVVIIAVASMVEVKMPCHPWCRGCVNRFSILKLSGSLVLGVDLAIAFILEPERVLSVSREEVGFDLVGQDVVPLIILALSERKVFDRNCGNFGVQFGKLGEV